MSEGSSPPKESSSGQQSSSAADGPEDATLVVPIGKLKMIYDTVPDVLPLSSDGSAALSLAVECFVQDLIEKAQKHSKSSELDYDEFSSMIRDNDDFSWLHEFVPKRCSYDRALSRIRAKGNL